MLINHSYARVRDMQGGVRLMAEMINKCGAAILPRTMITNPANDPDIQLAENKANTITQLMDLVNVRVPRLELARRSQGPPRLFSQYPETRQDAVVVQLLPNQTTVATTGDTEALEQKLKSYYVAQVLVTPVATTAAQDVLVTFRSNSIQSAMSIGGYETSEAVGSTLTLRYGQPSHVRPQPISESWLRFQTAEDEQRLLLAGAKASQYDSLFQSSEQQPGVVFCKANEILSEDELEPEDREIEVAVLFEQHLFARLLCANPNRFGAQRVYSFAWHGLRTPEEPFEVAANRLPYVFIVIPKAKVFEALCENACKLRGALKMLRASDLTLEIESAQALDTSAKTPKLISVPEVPMEVVVKLFAPVGSEGHPHLLYTSGVRPYLTESGLVQCDVMSCIRDSINKVTRCTIVKGPHLSPFHFSATKKALIKYLKTVQVAEKNKVEMELLKQDSDKIIVDTELLLVCYLLE